LHCFPTVEDLTNTFQLLVSLRCCKKGKILIVLRDVVVSITITPPFEDGRMTIFTQVTMLRTLQQNEVIGTRAKYGEI